MASRNIPSPRRLSKTSHSSRRASRTVESWVLSDLGRLTMTPRPAHILPTLLENHHLQLPLSPPPTFPAPSYSPPPTPRRHPDWMPDATTVGSRSPSTTSSSSSSLTSSASSMEDLDELPDYDTFLREQESVKIKPFANDDREVVFVVMEVEGSEDEDEDEEPVAGQGRRVSLWRSLRWR